METVAIFEAKSRLSEILAAVEKGEEFTVTKRGEPIARIVPYRQAPTDAAVAQSSALIARLRAARDAAPVDDFDLRGAIEDGRD
jgi:prevent-host-death family protein